MTRRPRNTVIRPISYEYLKLLISQINVVRKKQDLGDIDQEGAESINFVRDLDSAAKKYWEQKITTVPHKKAIITALRAANKTRDAIAGLKEHVPIIDYRYQYIDSTLNALQTFDEYFSLIKNVSRGRGRHSNWGLKLTTFELADLWTRYTGVSPIVSRASQASDQRPRTGPFVDFVETFLSAIHPGHGYRNVGRSLDEIMSEIRAR